MIGRNFDAAEFCQRIPAATFESLVHSAASIKMKAADHLLGFGEGFLR